MKNHWLGVSVVAAMLLAVPGAGSYAGESPSSRAKPGSVTVFPVVITPEQKLAVGVRHGIAEVIGMLLERIGLEDVELSTTDFDMPKDENLDQVAAAFGRFVREQAIGTDYALLAHFVGTPGKGVDEIDTILVDRQGAVIMAGRDNSQTFAKISDLVPKDPMTASVFVARRVQRFWNLGNPLRENAPTGKLAEAWREKTGVPSKREIAAMNERLDEMKAELGTCRLEVYPVRIGDSSDAECATRLAKAITDAGLCSAVAGDETPDLKIRGNYNEQKVLWDTARGFRRYLEAHPPAEDYALYADYAIASPGTPKAKVMAVHVVVCDRKGRWVLVDYQNSEQPDFQEIDPKSADDCNRLVVLRLKQRLDEK